MFLHAGNSKNIPLKNIIGIFDMDTATVSEDTKNFLKSLDKAGFTETLVTELPKSFILTDTDEVVFSQISTSSLIGRI
ncbi:MAG: DUF370 domain-containing protein [Clostridia bacterium]|nr:DUF370 domain-containing protein [Clostridia bacterium]